MQDGSSEITKRIKPAKARTNPAMTPHARILESLLFKNIPPCFVIKNCSICLVNATMSLHEVETSCRDTYFKLEDESELHLLRQHLGKVHHIAQLAGIGHQHQREALLFIQIHAVLF